MSLTLEAISASFSGPSGSLATIDWKVIISPNTEATSSVVIREYSFNSPFLTRVW